MCVQVLNQNQRSYSHPNPHWHIITFYVIKNRCLKLVEDVCLLPHTFSILFQLIEDSRSNKITLQSAMRVNKWEEKTWSRLNLLLFAYVALHPLFMSLHDKGLQFYPVQKQMCFAAAHKPLYGHRKTRSRTFVISNIDSSSTFIPGSPRQLLWQVVDILFLKHSPHIRQGHGPLKTHVSRCSGQCGQHSAWHAARGGVTMTWGSLHSTGVWAPVGFYPTSLSPQDEMLPLSWPIHLHQGKHGEKGSWGVVWRA